jgi:hypothetical protein
MLLISSCTLFILCRMSWFIVLKSHVLLAAFVRFGLHSIHMLFHMHNIYMVKMSYFCLLYVTRVWESMFLWFDFVL